MGGTTGAGSVKVEFDEETGLEKVVKEITENARGAVALGEGALAQKSYTYAIGQGAKATADNTAAIGNGAEASYAGSVALGQGSKALEKVDEPSAGGYNPITGEKDYTDNTKTWTATTGPVSVGSKDVTRQIKYVAAGNEDTDAVNVAQLKQVVTAVDNSKTHYYHVNSNETGKGSNYDNDGATGKNAIAAGLRATATADDAVAFGNGAQASVAGGIALGSGSVASTPAGVNGVNPLNVNYEKYNPAWTSTDAAVSVGGGTYTYARRNNDGKYVNEKGEIVTSEEEAQQLTSIRTRQITGVAAGTNPTDAVNVAQLQGTTTHYYSVNENKAHDDVAGDSNYDNSGATGKGSLAAGYYANAAGEEATAFGYGSQSKEESSSSLGSLSKATARFATAVGHSAQAIGVNSTATGSESVAAGENSTAVGLKSEAFGRGTIAIGHESTAGALVSVNKTGEGTDVYYTTDVIRGGENNEYIFRTLNDAATTTNGEENASGGNTENTENTSGGNTEPTVNPASVKPAGKKLLAASPMKRGLLGDAIVPLADTNDAKKDESGTDGGNSGTNSGTSGTVVAYNVLTQKYHEATPDGNGGYTIGKEIKVDETSLNMGGIAMGSYAHAEGYRSMSIGRASGSYGEDSTAVGIYSNAMGKGDLALGHGSSTGVKVRVVKGGADDFWTTSFYEADENGKETTTPLTQTNADGKDVSVLDENRNPVANGNNGGIAIGSYSHTEGTRALAVGRVASAYGTNSTAIGLRSSAYGEGSMAFGHGVVAGDETAPYATQTPLLHENPYSPYDLDGTSTLLVDTNGKPILDKDGNEQFIKVDPNNVIGAVAMGSYAEATGRGSLSVGRYSKAQSAYSTAMGIRAKVGANAKNSIAIGREVTVGEVLKDDQKPSGETIENSVAIGKGSTVTGSNSIAIGTDHQVGGNNSGAIGDPNVVNANNSYTVGNNSTIEKGADDSFIFGNNRIVKGKGSVVAGSATKETTTEAANSVVLGNDANVELEGKESVALGSGAKADRLGGYASPAANDITVGNLTFSSNAFAGTGSDVAGTVSVGSAGRTRTLTYVGAGEISATSTDAINGSQLYSAIEAMQFDIVAGDNVEVVKDKQNGKTVYTIHSLNAIVEAEPSGNVTVKPKTGENGTTNGKTTDKTGNTAGTTTATTGGTGTPVATTEAITPDKANNHTTTYTVDAQNTTYNMTSEKTTNEEDGSTTTTVTLKPSEGTEQKVTFTDTNTHTSVVDDGMGYVTVERTDKEVTAKEGPEYKVSLDVDKLKKDIGGASTTVKAGDRITVVNEKGSAEYTINGANVKDGDNMKVTYNEKANEFTVATKADVKFDNVEVTKEFKAGDTTINKGGITTNNVTAGDTSINNDGITIKNGGPKGDIVINKNNVDMGGNRITNVAPGEAGTDAVNVDQLNSAMNQTGDTINRLGDQISKVDNRMKKGLAGAAALAALHPLEFDPDDKLTFAAGLGNYRGENAAAIGAFYRADEKVMFSLGGTVGNGENLVNAGISFSLDRVPHVTNTKAAMAREILDLRREVLELKASMASGNWMLDPTLTRLFPDTAENHWAYEYVKTLAGNHIIEGYPDGEFKGDQMITRYEMAAILYRAMMNGAKLPDKALNEFADELGRFRVDRIYGNGDDRHKVERIRVNDENRKDRDVYGSRYEYFKQHPGANISTGALPGTDRAERAAKAEAALS